MLGNPPNSTAGILDADIQSFIGEAIRRFSADAPQVAYTDYTGNGVAFDFTLPVAWVAGFSSVRTIEYPQGNRPATYLDDLEWVLYPDSSAPSVIRLNLTTPDVGAKVRVGFTLPYPIPDASVATDLVSGTDF